MGQCLPSYASTRVTSTSKAVAVGRADFCAHQPPGYGSRLTTAPDPDAHGGFAGHGRDVDASGSAHRPVKLLKIEDDFSQHVNHVLACRARP